MKKLIKIVCMVVFMCPINVLATNNEVAQPMSFTTILAISAVVGLIVAFIATSIMKSNMNTAHKKQQAREYIREDSFEVKRSHEKFIKEETEKTEKQKPQNNSKKTPK